jgi:electron transfer flavoprotein alpha subunit
VIALVVVRDGALPLGAEEAVSEAGGRALLAGRGTKEAVHALEGVATEVTCWEAGEFEPGRWAATLVPVLAGEDVVLLPASPDGRDLAPRLALSLDRPLHAPSLRVGPAGAAVVRGGGLSLVEVEFNAPVVATLEPGCRGVDPRPGRPSVRRIRPKRVAAADAEPVRTIEADPAQVDLAEARRIMAGGAGLGSPEAMAQLGEVATALGCATGATRVVADAGWCPFERQIGTTGAVVSPDLYIAVGISGAVQHVSGIGSPRDVVAVNTDPSCPMMGLADLAVVADGPGVLRALGQRLGLGGGAGPERHDPGEGSDG